MINVMIKAYDTFCARDDYVEAGLELLNRSR